MDDDDDDDRGWMPSVGKLSGELKRETMHFTAIP